MKRTLRILTAILFAAVLCMPVFGCSIFKERLNKPECVLLDDYVYWAAVEGASGYVVNVNGEDKPVQNFCGYTLDRDKEYTVKVKAVAPEKNSDFRDSEYCSVTMRSPDPTQFEKISAAQLKETRNEQNDYVYTLSGAGCHIEVDETQGLGSTVFITVPSEVKMIRVSTHGTTLPASFKVESRSDMLIFELDGARIKPYVGGGITLDGVSSGAKNYADIAVRSMKSSDIDEEGKPVKRENAIIGGQSYYKGKDGGDGAGAVGEGGNGMKGNNGCVGIGAPVVYVSGVRGLSVTGGDGTPGGNGGTGTGVGGWTGNNGGDGGDGGDGGTGIDASFVYVNIISGEPLEAVGGSGGEGGRKGSMGGVAGGIFGGSLNSAKDGNRGASGKGISGTPVIIAGKITN